MDIIFDIGGTQTRVAAVKNSTEFFEPRIYPTPQLSNDGISQLQDCIEQYAQCESIVKIVGGFPGIVDMRNVVMEAPNLTGWVGFNFNDLKLKNPEANIYIENDAALVGLGEATVGSGIGYEVQAYVTVSTGVGGARIVNGQIDKAAQNFELGKQIIESKGESLENLIGGRALEVKLGKGPESITDDIFWDEKARLLATGLVTLIAKWNPDAIVIGGAMTHDVGIDVEKVKEHLSPMILSMPVIKKASLGDMGGLHGALAYLRKKKYNSHS